MLQRVAYIISHICFHGRYLSHLEIDIGAPKEEPAKMGHCLGLLVTSSFVFACLSLAAPYYCCRETLAAITETIWKTLPVTSTITLAPQGTRSAESLSRSVVSESSNIIAVDSSERHRTSTSVGLSKAKTTGFGPELHYVGSEICSQSDPCTGKLTYLDTARKPNLQAHMKSSMTEKQKLCLLRPINS